MNTLGHINIRTDRMEETLRFYETVLGFRRGAAMTNPNPAQNMWLYDEEGGACVHINALREGEAMLPGNGACLNHVAFNCADRDAMTALLAREGIAYVTVQTAMPTLVQYNVYDPNGVKVELTFGHETLPRL